MDEDALLKIHEKVKKKSLHACRIKKLHPVMRNVYESTDWVSSLKCCIEGIVQALDDLSNLCSSLNEEKNILKCPKVSSNNTDNVDKDDFSIFEDADTKKAEKIVLGINENNRKKLLDWYKNLDEKKKVAIKKASHYVVSSNFATSDRFKNIGQKTYEIREHEFGLRLYLMFYKGVATVVEAGDKATQDSDIKEARRIINDTTR